jgi:hypothetical protein
MKGLFYWCDYTEGDNVDTFSRAITKRNINQEDWNQNTPLFSCIFRQSPNCLAYLLSLGVDINKKKKGHKFSVFHFAVFAEFPQAITMLANYNKACINSRDARGYTPLHYALQRIQGYRSAVELLQCGANVNLLTPKNDSPMDLLSYAWSTEQADVFAKNLVIAGGWYNRTKRKNQVVWLIEFRRSLSKCRLAVRALNLALKKKGAIHKDIIPLICDMVEKTREQTNVWSF